MIPWAVPVVWTLWRARCWTSSLSAPVEGTAAVFMHVLACCRWSEGLQNARPQKPKSQFAHVTLVRIGRRQHLAHRYRGLNGKNARACRQVEQMDQTAGARERQQVGSTICPLSARRSTAGRVRKQQEAAESKCSPQSCFSQTRFRSRESVSAPSYSYAATHAAYLYVQVLSRVLSFRPKCLATVGLDADSAWPVQASSK